MVDGIVLSIFGTRDFELSSSLSSQLVLLDGVSQFGGRVIPTNLGHTKNRFPATILAAIMFRWEPEPSADESALGPSVVDAGKVPINGLRGSVLVELVANINELLNTGDVDVVDGAEVQDDGFQGWLARDIVFFMPKLRSGVTPRSVSGSAIGERVGPPGDLEDVLSELVKIVIGIWIVESFGEAVNENTRVRRFHLDVRIGPIVMVNWQEDVASAQLWILLVTNKVISLNRVDLNLTQKASFSFQNAEQEDG